MSIATIKVLSEALSKGFSAVELDKLGQSLTAAALTTMKTLADFAREVILQQNAVNRNALDNNRRELREHNISLADQHNRQHFADLERAQRAAKRALMASAA